MANVNIIKEPIYYLPAGIDGNDGLLTADDQQKLNGIASGAEVNQNAFSNVKVGTTTIEADTKTDTLELVAGDNVTLTPDATNDKITISSKNSFPETGTGLGYNTTAGPGNPITITDALPVPALEVTAEIEPIQDLHGYSEPWVGGAGKNKAIFDLDAIKEANTAGTWSDNAYTYQGVTYTFNDDGSFYVDNTATANAMLHYIPTRENWLDGTYTLSDGYGQTAKFWAYLYDTTALRDVANLNSPNFTINGSNNITFRMFASTGNTFDHVLIKPMIRPSTESADWMPWENICPIAGHSSLGIDDEGKNRWNVPYIRSKVTEYTYGGITYNLNTDGTVDISAGTVSASESLFPNTIPNVITEADINQSYDLIPDTLYTVSFGIPFSDAYHGQVYVKTTSTSNWSIVANISSGTEFNFRTLNSFYRYLIRLQILGNGTSVPAMTIKPMIRPADISDASFVPYSSRNFVAQFGQTVYGCTANPVTGVGSITHKGVDMGDLTWNYDAGTTRFYSGVISDIDAPSGDVVADVITEQFKATYANGQPTRDDCTIAISVSGAAWVYNTGSGTDKTAFASLVDGHMMVYKLATPIPITFDPVTLQLLSGYNQLSSDGGGDMSLTYFADSITGSEEGKTLNLTLKSNELSTLAAAPKGDTANREYAVGLDKNGVLSVNVPWTDGSTGYTAGTGIAINGTTISNTGVRNVAEGTVNGTVNVNANGSTANVAVHGLGSAAYTASTSYAVNSTLTNQDLNTITDPGFYNAGGGNTCTNKPENTDAFALVVMHSAAGNYYIQTLYKNGDGNAYRRVSNNGTWDAWSKDKYTDTTYSGANGVSLSGTTFSNSGVRSVAEGTVNGAVNVNTNGSTANVLVHGLGSLAYKSSVSKSDVGLGNVANIDQSKAISSITRSGTTFTATALDGTTTSFTQQDNNTTYSDATTTTSGLMSASDKVKLNGVATGAEVNQNAFSNVKVGSTTVAADAKTDTLELVAGSNITLTPDATNDKVTIAATNTTYSGANGVSLSGTTFSNSGVRAVATGSNNGTINVNTNGSTANVAVKGLGDAAYKAVTTSVTSGSADLVTSGAVYTAIDNLPEPMVFKGSLGTGGTITALPVDGTATIGDTYKVITAGTYASKSAKVGDTFICLTKTASANTWELIPSGDEPSGTVTSIATGVGLTGGTITSSGTIKAKLRSETALTNDSAAATETSGRVYPVAQDKSGYLAVNVPWSNTTYTGANGVSLSGTTFSNSGVRSIAEGTTAGTINVNTNGSTANVAVKDAGKAIKSITRSGTTFTATAIDGSTTSFTQQDNNTWTAMVGATSAANGSVGYVNAVPPKDGYNTKYLRADGTWTVPPDNNTWRGIQNNLTSDSTTESLSAAQGKALNNNKVAKSGDTMTGNLTIKKSDTYANNSPSVLTLATYDTTNSVTSQGTISAYDGGVNGANLVINPAGNMFISSGEAAAAHYALKTHDTGEVFYLDSDNQIHLQANCQTIANRVGMQIDNSGNVLPEKADVATNNIGSIGTSSYKWANGYFTNINGVAVGTPKFTDTTYTGANGVSLSGTTFSNSGVRSIAAGTTNGTINVNTNGSTADVAVKGLGSNAYTSTSYLPIAGGTLTGNMNLKYSNIDASKADNGVTSTLYPTTFSVLDKNDKILTRKEGVIESNGNISAYWYVRNYNTSGTQVGQKGIKITLNKSGTMTYTVDDNANFKTAIGIGNVANYDQSKAIKSITRSGTTFTATALDGTTTSFTQQDNNTTNTAGATDTSSKIFLIGATSQAAAPQTYSDNEVYVTSGVLTTKSVQVGGTAATMQYNSTNKCIDFVFA